MRARSCGSRTGCRSPRASPSSAAAPASIERDVYPTRYPPTRRTPCARDSGGGFAPVAVEYVATLHDTARGSRARYRPADVRAGAARTAALDDRRLVPTGRRRLPGRGSDPVSAAGAARRLGYPRPQSMAPRFATALLGALLAAVAARLAASSADAAPTALWPGVTYRPTVQFTPRGPVAINVLRGPRPGGLTTLEPVLSNDTVRARDVDLDAATAHSTAPRPGSTATSPVRDRPPVGVFLRDGELASPPNPRRSSAGMSPTGRSTSAGSRSAPAGRARAPSALPPERPADDRRRRLYTRLRAGDAGDPGRSPRCSFPFRPRHPGSTSPRRSSRSSMRAAVPIPAGGAVLVARVSGAAVTAEAPVGSELTVRLDFVPRGPGSSRPSAAARSSSATGAPLWDEREVHAGPARPRAPRSAVGQLANGRVSSSPSTAGSRATASGSRASSSPALVAARATHGDGARQRRLDDDGVRRNVAQPSLGRSRAPSSRR